MIKKMIATSVLTMGIAFIATPAMAAEPSSSGQGGGTLHIQQGAESVTVHFSENFEKNAKDTMACLESVADKKMKKNGKDSTAKDAANCAMSETTGDVMVTFDNIGSGQ